MNILLAEDDAGSQGSIKSFLERLGHKVEACPDGDEAIALLRNCNQRYDLVLSDIRMPGKSGIEVLAFIKQACLVQPPRVVLFTGHGTMNTAIEAMRLGAMDFLLKPVDAEQLVAMMERVETSLEIKHPSPSRSIGVFSEAMQKVIWEAEKYGTDRTIPVLIKGETGTGKELIARIIHESGGDEGLPFVDINCAAISASLFESELFGYEPGAFTGGRAKGQKGKFDLANGGTLFLDEVAEIPIELQGKLLRVLQEKEFYRVGGLHKVKTDVRIICATNVNLEDAIKDGKFRRDLYYRLNVGQLFLPPLRERKEEIVPLAKKFLCELAKAKKKAFQDIEPEAAQMLINYQWLGNVRELRNVIERAVFMHDDVSLKAEHLDGLEGIHFKKAEKTASLPEDVRLALAEDQPLDAGLLIDAHVVSLVERAVKTHNGNKAAAARSLGISRSSVYRILERSKAI